MPEEIEPQPRIFLRTTSELTVARRAVGDFCGKEHELTLRLSDLVAHRDWEEGVVVPYFAGEESQLIISALFAMKTQETRTYGQSWEQAQASYMLRQIAAADSTGRVKRVE